jgi:hypothetical protein
MRNAIKMVGLVSALALSACGGEKGDALGRFVGTWQATAGTATTVCPGYPPSTSVLTGNAEFREGLSSDLVASTAIIGCPLLADVMNATASGTPGQNCITSDGAGGTSTVTFTSYTFVVSPDGHTASENSSGQIAFVDQGVSFACAFNETGSYQKISN